MIALQATGQNPAPWHVKEAGEDGGFRVSFKGSIGLL